MRIWQSAFVVRGCAAEGRVVTGHLKEMPPHPSPPTLHRVSKPMQVQAGVSLCPPVLVSDPGPVRHFSSLTYSKPVEVNGHVPGAAGAGGEGDCGGSAAAQ